MSRCLAGLGLCVGIAFGTACSDPPMSPVPRALQIIYRGQLASGDGGFIVMNADGTDKKMLARQGDGFFCPALCLSDIPFRP
jgi:hypothetical protein